MAAKCTKAGLQMKKMFAERLQKQLENLLLLSEERVSVYHVKLSLPGDRKSAEAGRGCDWGQRMSLEMSVIEESLWGCNWAGSASCAQRKYRNRMQHHGKQKTQRKWCHSGQVRGQDDCREWRFIRNWRLKLKLRWACIVLLNSEQRYIFWD